MATTLQSLKDELKKYLAGAGNAVNTARVAAGNAATGMQTYFNQQPVPKRPALKEGLGAQVRYELQTPLIQAKNKLNAAGEALNIVTSYPFGGIIKAGNEQRQGTYVAPKIGPDFNLPTITGKPLKTNIGEFIAPPIVGAVRGVRDKQPLMTEVPKAVGVDPNSLPGFAIGLTAEVLAPGPGELKTAKEIDKFSDLNKGKKFLVSLINKAGSEDDAVKVIERLSEDALKSTDAVKAKNFRTALSSQLLRFNKFEGNPNAAKILGSLKQNILKLSDSAVDTQVPKILKENVEQSVLDVAKKDFQDFSLIQRSKTPGVRQLVSDAGKAIEDATVSPLAQNVEALKDISPTSKGLNTVYRNFQTAFGQNFAEAKRLILDPFDAAKGKFIDDQAKWLGELDATIQKGLGITKGSKLSELTQLFGEGKITLPELQSQTKDWQKVVDADSFFRGMYDKMLDEVNAARAAIYPNNPEKLIPKRSDYYRHFQELERGFEGLLNIFDTPANISSNLAGASDFTKPKTKFLGFAQKRKGDETVVDAVGGFLNYIKSAAYAKNIDPQIGKFRSLADELAKATAEGTGKEGTLNNFIEFLQDFANDLSGKTNPLDRGMQKYVGRKTMKSLEWINSRFKANTVLGNLSSSLNQTLSVPAGVADAGPKNFALGTADTLASIFKSDAPVNQSTFLKERYFSSAYDKFEPSLLDKPRQFAAWVLGIGDEIGSKLIWNAEYRKALDAGVEDAVKFADDATRNVVAGRGVGEVPIAQKAKLTQILTPFQLEVANQWYVMKGWVDNKQFGKIVAFFIANNIANNAIEQVTGQRPAFDPIEALQAGIEAYQEEDETGKGVAKLAGRLGGEVLGNLPFANQVVSSIPLNDKFKKEYFGEQDPSRFGGGIPAARLLGAIQDPSKALYIIPPFGGAQIRKTYQGLVQNKEGGVYDDKGNLKYPIGDELSAKLQSAAFGPYASKESRVYFGEELANLSPLETATWSRYVREGNDPTAVWIAIQKSKLERGLSGKVSNIMGDVTLTQEEKTTGVKDVIREYRNLIGTLDGFMQEVKKQPAVVPPEQTSATPQPTTLPGYTAGKTAFKVKKGKKGRKPAYPTMPKLQQKSVVDGVSARAVDYTYDVPDLEELTKLGQLPEIDLRIQQ